MNDNEEELKMVDVQLLITFVLIGTIISSAVLGYNSHLQLSGQKPFITKEQEINISIISKIIVFIVAILAFILALQDIERVKKKNGNPESAYMAAGAALLIAIAALMVLISDLRKNGDSFSEIENPEA